MRLISSQFSGEFRQDRAMSPQVFPSYLSFRRRRGRLKCSPRRTCSIFPGAEVPSDASPRRIDCVRAPQSKLGWEGSPTHQCSSIGRCRFESTASGSASTSASVLPRWRAIASPTKRFETFAPVSKRPSRLSSAPSASIVAHGVAANRFTHTLGARCSRVTCSSSLVTCCSDRLSQPGHSLGSGTRVTRIRFAPAQQHFDRPACLRSPHQTQESPHRPRFAAFLNEN
jgi:hypothetical protein